MRDYLGDISKERQNNRLVKARVLLIFVVALLIVVATSSGGFLVVNDLEHADVIVVLAGETNRRPATGLQLLGENYAPRMLLDVPVNNVIYDRNLSDIAQSYLADASRGQSVSICPIYGLSTKAEAGDVLRCLNGSGVHRILVVTSDYHTRRARSIFQHELRGDQIFVTPAFDPQQFGAHWWQHRQWAKMNFDEWTRLVWWELVDRWR